MVPCTSAVVLCFLFLPTDFDEAACYVKISLNVKTSSPTTICIFDCTEDLLVVCFHLLHKGGLLVACVTFFDTVLPLLVVAFP
jgi:hypothetical protein